MQTEGKQPMESQQHSAADAPRPLIDNAAESMLGPNPFIGFRPQDIAAAFGELAGQALRRPLTLLEQEAALLRELVAIASGRSQLSAAGDKRFSDPAWQDNPFYRRCLQTYLAWTKSVTQFAEQSGSDRRTAQRARFAASLLTDAAAPTNTLVGNPAALRKILDSGGASVVAGLKNILSDIAANGWMPSQVDKRAFKVGENLALSKGAVVLTTPVLELIQYSPTTEAVHARPHLIVPPQINKFYFFDLAPGRSIVEHLTRSQFQVFAISWRNPTAAQRDWDMETYVAAIREAIEAIQDITGSPDVIVHAACSGAMTATILAGLLAARRERLIHAMTLMVAVLGGSPDTQLGLFATPEVIAAAKLETTRRGVLDGDEMGRVFAWMRPNDLIWSYWVNNYLMGNPPPAFDILYWNNDTTRLPAKFHGTLIDIFANNWLLQPGELKLFGHPIDVSKIDCDKFIVAGLTDHITPWRDGYRMARALGGNNEFVLSSGGHIQTLINPTGSAKVKFFVNPKLALNPDDWLVQAKPVAGSWWEHWRSWLAERSAEIRAAPQQLGNDRYPRGADAPGTYVSAG
jgi:poly[(R)-3-hydroxyalkanoate] polymerase subunit PhaC